PYVLLHLTRNKEQLLQPAPDPERASAINLKGRVHVHLRPNDAIDTYEFHFIQLVRLMAMRAEYAGRTPSEGYFFFDEALPPVFAPQWAKKFCLDSGGTFIPYTNREDPDIVPERGGLRVTTEMDDHPYTSFPVLLQNEKTKQTNLLFRT